MVTTKKIVTEYTHKKMRKKFKFLYKRNQLNTKEDSHAENKGHKRYNFLFLQIEK